MLQRIITSMVLIGAIQAGTMTQVNQAYKAGKYQQALHGYTEAAKQKNGEALYRIGQMYAFGKGVNKNPQKAREYYLKSAEAGYAKAQYDMAVLYRYDQQFDRMKALLGDAIKQGYAPAMNFTGLLYFKGEGGYSQAYDQALAWYHKAAEAGSATGMYNVAKAYEKGYGVTADFAKALTYYLAAAKAGHGPSQSIMAHAYERGNGVARDPQQSRMWYLKASESGEMGAIVQTGSFYFTGGNGFGKNYAEGVRYFKFAAERGNAIAQKNLAIAYQNGMGVKRDLNTALHWYEKAADQGNVGAMRAIGQIYKRAKRYREAAQWHAKGARRGDKYSQSELGWLYENGKGVKKDYKKAFKFYTKAAKQGEPVAQYYLAVMYYNGRGVKRNLKMAKRWMTTCARQGDKDAKAFLKKYKF